MASLPEREKAMENEWIENILMKWSGIYVSFRDPKRKYKTENPDMPLTGMFRCSSCNKLDLGKSMDLSLLTMKIIAERSRGREESDTEIGIFGHADVVLAGKWLTCPQPFKPACKGTGFLLEEASATIKVLYDSFVCFKIFKGTGL